MAVSIFDAAATIRDQLTDAIDTAIAVVDPLAAAKRKQARMAFNKIRKYEGASTGRRTSGWTTSDSAANTEVRAGLVRLRARARDLVRNNPYAARGVSVITHNVVGHGISAGLKSRNKRHEKAWGMAWKNWAGTTACDADGRHNLHGLQRLWMRAIVESGEVLIRMRRDKDNPYVPLRLQTLESDFLDIHRYAAFGQNENLIINGVEFNREGQRVAYWLYDEHPGGDGYRLGTIRSRRVPASEVIHLYRMDRPGQHRGITWFAPVIIRLRDFDVFEDAKLQQQQVAACFGAFIRDVGDDTIGKSDEDDLPALVDRLEPAMLEYLQPGQDISFATPPKADDGAEYSRAVLHSIASGLGVTYEQLTGDFSQVNFSSARMAWVEFHRNLDDWQNNIMVPGLQSVAAWFQQAAALKGLPDAELDWTWSFPRRVMVDPTKEIPALVAEVRAGFKSPSEAIRTLGYDPEKLLEEWASDKEMLDKLGLTLDIDPLLVSRSGNLNDDPDEEPMSEQGE